jgi:Ras-related protein Rab-32
MANVFDEDEREEEGKDSQLYKCLVIGDYAVGKTSIIKRYVDGCFSSKYKLTIGVDFAVKVLDWDENTRISCQLWDVAGHERFGTSMSFENYFVFIFVDFSSNRILKKKKKTKKKRREWQRN